MLFSKNKLKFLSDENFPKKVDELLKEKGHDVKKVLLGASDKQLLPLVNIFWKNVSGYACGVKIAKSESRVILTFDKHFINKNLFPPKEHSGIVVLKISPPLIDTTFSLLSKLLKEIKPSEFKGRLFVVSLFRFISYPDNLF